MITTGSRTINRAVVTGGAGFIGSHLVEHLLLKGCSVHVIDDLSSGSLENLPSENPKLTFEKIDIDQAAIDPAIREKLFNAVSQVDIVFHLASPIGVHLVHSNRLQTTRRILQGGIAVVEACRHYRCPLFFASSSEVYGEGGDRLLKESAVNICGTESRWCYGTAKLSIEHMVTGLYEELGVPTWIGRFFNIIGPRQNPQLGMVVAKFCTAVHQLKPILIHGDGTQRRSFLHVSDLVIGIIAVISSTELHGIPVNIGSAESASVNDIAHRIIECTGRFVPIVYKSYEEVFGLGFIPVLQRCPDLNLIKKAAGWQPSHSLFQALLDCTTNITLVDVIEPCKKAL